MRPRRHSHLHTFHATGGRGLDSTDRLISFEVRNIPGEIEGNAIFNHDDTHGIIRQ